MIRTWGVAGVRQPWPTAGVAGSEGPAWIRFSYGELPTRSQFDSHFRQIVGQGPYEMELVGQDAAFMQAHYGGTEFTGAYGKAGYALDADELWGVVVSLTKAFDGGDDDAGDFASSILFTLNFEWF